MMISLYMIVQRLFGNVQPLPKFNITDSHGNADRTLRLAVGVALVPIGALITFTAQRKQ